MITKKIFTIVFAITTIFIFAQSGTLDSRKILASIPELAKIDTLVAKEQMRYNQEYNAKAGAAQKVQDNAVELNKKNPKDPAITKLKADLDKMITELQTYQQTASKKLTEYKDLLYKPYIEKINAAVKTVAERRKYNQVFDIQVVALAYLNPATDITEEVIKEIAKK